MSLTLVTMLYDVPRRTGICRRSIQEYLEYGKTILGLEQDMVIYCDLELANDIKKLRNTNVKTEIIASPFEGVPQYKWIWYIKKNWPAETTIGRVPEEIALGWSKPQILCDVATRNPFNSTHVGFIDIGITHIVPITSITPNLFNNFEDKVKLHMLRYVNKTIVDDPTYYYTPQTRLAAGYIVGPTENIKQLSLDFDKEIEYILSMDGVAIDEDLLARMVAHNPEKYLYSYGGYQDIFSNHNGIYNNIYYMGNLMADARGYNDWAFVCKMGKHILENYRNNKLNCNMEELELVLDEYFTGAYYIEYPNQNIITEIANLYAELLENQDFYSAYLKRQELVKYNFSFLNCPPKLP